MAILMRQLFKISYSHTYIRSQIFNCLNMKSLVAD
jgi:hypothetical protein